MIIDQLEKFARYILAEELDIEARDKAFYEMELADLREAHAKLETDNETAKQRAQEKNARIVAALKRVEYTGHATSLPDAVEWCANRIAGLTAELEERRAEQAPLGEEVTRQRENVRLAEAEVAASAIEIATLREQASELRSKLTETCVHNGQIAMLLAETWKQIAESGGEPNTENCLIELMKAGRIRDMETVKHYMEECGQLRATKAWLKEELRAMKAERDELAALRETTAPVKALSHSDPADYLNIYERDVLLKLRQATNGHSESVLEKQVDLPWLKALANAARLDVVDPLPDDYMRDLGLLKERPTPPITQLDIATALMDRTGVDYEPEDIDPDSEIGRDAAAVFELLQRRGYPGPAPHGYPTWQQVKAKWDELTEREATNEFEDEGDFLNYLKANLPDSNPNENEKVSAA